MIAYINGKIWIEKNIFQEAFIVKGKKIIFVGQTKDALEFKPKTIIDLNKKLVIPGLMDSHVHFYFGAKYESYLDLSKIKNHKDLINELLVFNKKHNFKNDDVLIGYDWDEEQFEEKKMISKKYLDDHFPNLSVFLWRKSYHSAFANTHALKRLGIYHKNATYEKSYIELGEDKMPTGFLKEKICYKVDALISAERNIQYQKDFIKWVKKANNFGITGIFTCDLRNENWEFDLNVFEKLNNKNKLSLEISHQMWLTEEKWINNFLAKIQHIKLKKNNHQIRAIKVFADGTFSNNTLNLKTTNSLDNLFIDKEKFYEFVKKINSYNLSVVTHSIGDLTSEVVIKNYAMNDHSNLMRNGLIHSDVMNKKLVKLIKNHNIYLSLQPCFLKENYFFNDKMEISPYKTLVKNKINISFGTDWKVCDLNPWCNIHLAINHPNPKQKIKLWQALEAYTLGTAKYMNIDDKVGKIAKNYYANFIILEKDIFRNHKKNIHKTIVLSTYFRGKKVSN
ncbi:amidohydrolase [Mesomycoplasma neurolyticum]|uniref:Imidazolonepropionase n=1 Tax=Mesomycoplasma neurolyticum TaxID=2120 RepID=A0A449A4M0_9BACT|nr:amidohydrolase family protein [Mesomycoplasma neurolyticum]VEU59179.1 imidazolonepropionase [Mesomycoplasma neurolyticum]